MDRGSTPLISTNGVSVRTTRTDRYKNQSENKIWLIFCCLKTISKSSKWKNSAFDSIPDETNDSIVYMKEPTPILISVKPIISRLCIKLQSKIKKLLVKLL